MRIPADGPERLRVQVASIDGDGPFFTVEARHEDAQALTEAAGTALYGISKTLQQAWGLADVRELTDHRHYWAHVHPPQEWVGEGDVVATLLDFAKADIATLVDSGIFAPTALGTASAAVAQPGLQTPEADVD